MKKDILIDDNIILDHSISVHAVDLFGASRGLVRKHEDSFIIFIEESLSFACKVESLKHEIAHIILGHLDDDIKTIEEKEHEAIVFSKSIFF